MSETIKDAICLGTIHEVSPSTYEGLPHGTKIYAVPPVTYNIVLTEGEAQVLRSLFEQVGGDPVRTARGNVDAMLGKLRAMNVDVHPAQKAEGFEGFVDVVSSRGSSSIYIKGRKL